MIASNRNDEGVDVGVPAGWMLASIRDVLLLNPPKPAADEVPPNTEVTFVPMPAVNAEAGAITNPQVRSFDEVRKGFTYFCDEDVIVAKITPCFENGKAAICRGLVNRMGFGSTEFHVLRSPGAVLPEYVYHFVRQQSFRREGEANMTGSVGQKRVPADWMRSVVIPVPPLPEQKRIVAKLEAVLARVNAARERLAKAPAILKRFRQSVLAAACSGRLTEDWRQGCDGKETGQQLLERVRRQVRAGRLSKTASKYAGGRVDQLDLFGTREVETTELPQIPESWHWVYLPQCGYFSRGKSRNRPRNAPHLYGGPYPFIQTGDIAQSGGRITSHRQTYSEAGLAQSRLWPADTMCITIAANIADTAILTYPACFPDSVVGLIAEPELVSIEFVEFFMRTARANLADFAPATAQKNINVGILSDLAVPLPPRAEQDEIVGRVTRLLALADKIEKRLGAATVRAEKMVQSVLAKAFRGELVPTEAELAEQEGREYETAEALIERIRRDRADAQPATRTRRSPRNGGTTPTSQTGNFGTSLFDEGADVDRDGNGDHDGRVKGRTRAAEASEKPKTASEPSTPDEISYDDAMAIVREVFSEGGSRDREQAIRDLAAAMGWERVGARVRETVDGLLRAAVRRGILSNEQGQYTLLVRSAADYTRDHLIDMLLASMDGGWSDRDDVVRATARHLGFRKAGSAFREEMKSAINGAIRRGLLEYEGERVRKR